MENISIGETGKPRFNGRNITLSIWGDESGTSGVSKRAASGENQPIGSTWKERTDGM